MSIFELYEVHFVGVETNTHLNDRAIIDRCTSVYRTAEIR